MAAYLNTLRAATRRGQWRFRQILRTVRADGRLDMSDAGLVDFSAVTAMVLTVVPRRPNRPWTWNACCEAEPAPVLRAELGDGILVVSNPGIVEAVFPAETLSAIPPGLYDVRLSVTIGPETTEAFNEPIELA